MLLLELNQFSIGGIADQVLQLAVLNVFDNKEKILTNISDLIDKVFQNMGFVGGNNKKRC